MLTNFFIPLIWPSLCFWPSLFASLGLSNIQYSSPSLRFLYFFYFHCFLFLWLIVSFYTSQSFFSMILIIEDLELLLLLFSPGLSKNTEILSILSCVSTIVWLHNFINLLEKKLDEDYERILGMIFWTNTGNHSTEQQQYGHLPPVLRSSQIKNRPGIDGEVKKNSYVLLPMVN